MRVSDILDELKRRHPDKTEEQLKLIISSFHNGLRHYLTHPLETKSGILINGLMSLHIPRKKIEKYIEKIELNNSLPNPKSMLRTDLDFYTKLKDNIKKHETRQTRRKNDNDGSVRRVSIEYSEE